MTSPNRVSAAPKGWRLRIPFELGDGKRLSLSSEPFKGTIAGKEWNVQEGSHGGYVAAIDGFSSKEEADSFLERACAGLYLASLEHETAVYFRSQLQSVAYADDPKFLAENLGFTGERVDGLISGHDPAVFPADQRVVAMTGGKATMTVGVSAERFAATVAVGAEHEAAAVAVRRDRIRTALDLYVAHFAEHSKEAKLLTLVIALEVMSVPSLKSSRARRLLERWQNEIDKEIARISTDDMEERESLDALKRELDFRREESLRQRVRRSVREALAAAGHPAADEMAHTALKVYDYRSALSHEGRLDSADLEFAFREAEVLVRVILRVALLGSPEAVAQAG